MNPWERAALQYHYPDAPSDTSSSAPSHDNSQATYEARQWRYGGAYDSSGIIYPGLYSASGFDMMSILIRVASRPNPKIDLGAIDGSCTFVLCDLLQPDTPAVYVSETFSELTGYSQQEALGRNCRFLQWPPNYGTPSTMYSSPTSSRSSGSPPLSSPPQLPGPNRETVRQIADAVRKCRELQIEVLNYKKNGQPFVNVLSLVPISWEQGARYRYCVGFLADRDAL